MRQADRQQKNENEKDSNKIEKANIKVVRESPLPPSQSDQQLPAKPYRSCTAGKRRWRGSSSGRRGNSRRWGEYMSAGEPSYALGPYLKTQRTSSHAEL